MKSLQDADVDTLRRRFAKLCEELPKGIRTDCFLSADNHAMAQAKLEQPYLVLWDVGYCRAGVMASGSQLHETSNMAVEECESINTLIQQLISPIYADIVENCGASILFGHDYRRFELSGKMSGALLAEIDERTIASN